MPKRLAILLLLLSSLFVEAQSIRLTHRQASTALFLDAENLYNFNLYERSRFEAAVTWVVPNEANPSAKHFLGQWYFRPYVAYSTGDKDFKYGVSALLRLPDRQSDRPHIFSHTILGINLFSDLERAASRNLSSYSVLSPSLYTGFVSSRYVGVRGGILTLNAVPTRSFSYNINLRQTWEDYRFDAQGVLYPALYPEQQAEVKRFSEFSTRLLWTQGFATDIQAGMMSDTAQHYYLRSLLQYATPIQRSGFMLFAQLGFASVGTPYSRMFDLSGTSNAWYFFRNSFLTVAPNTFTANIFSQFCINYTTANPLWDLSWSSPHPFLQFNALWGHLLGQDDTGYRLWDGLPLQSPNRGITEVAAGLNGLLRQGIMEFGFGAAYRFCPASATYYSNDFKHNFALTLVAEIILDEYQRQLSIP